MTFFLTDDTTKQVLALDRERVYADPVEVHAAMQLTYERSGDYRAAFCAALATCYPNGPVERMYRLGTVLTTYQSRRGLYPILFDPSWEAFLEPVVTANDGEDEGKYVGVKYGDRSIRTLEKPLWRGPVTAA